MYHETRIKALSILFLWCLSPALFAQTGQDALVEYRNANYAAAIEICKDEIERSADNLESHIVICWSLLKLKRYTEALQYTEAALRLGRYDTRVIEIAGEVHYFQGRASFALRYFQEYIDLAPEGQRIDTVYYYIGEIYIKQGRYRHADIALSTALHYAGGNAMWWTRLAYAREMSGDTHGAITAYSRALELNSNSPDAKQGLDRVKGTDR